MAIYKCKVTTTVERELVVNTRDGSMKDYIETSNFEGDAVYDFLVDCAKDIVEGEEVETDFEYNLADGVIFLPDDIGEQGYNSVGRDVTVKNGEIVKE